MGFASFISGLPRITVPLIYHCLGLCSFFIDLLRDIICYAIGLSLLLQITVFCTVPVINKLLAKTSPVLEHHCCGLNRASEPQDFGVFPEHCPKQTLPQEAGIRIWHHPQLFRNMAKYWFKLRASECPGPSQQPLHGCLLEAGKLLVETSQQIL